jgi:hypothetical protein
MYILWILNTDISQSDANAVQSAICSHSIIKAGLEGLCCATCIEESQHLNIIDAPLKVHRFFAAGLDSYCSACKSFFQIVDSAHPRYCCARFLIVCNIQVFIDISYLRIPSIFGSRNALQTFGAS